MAISKSLKKTSVSKLTVGDLLNVMQQFLDDYTGKTSTTDTIVGVQSLCHLLKKSPTTIYRYIKDGTIPEDARTKIGNTYYFNSRRIREILRQPV